jgi:hypothetical protein
MFMRQVMTSTDKLHRACLALLEVIVLTLYVTGLVVNLSFIGLWEYWLAMVFFWLIVLLLIASIKMFTKHRLLALIGLGLVAVIIVTTLMLTNFGGLR